MNERDSQVLARQQLDAREIELIDFVRGLVPQLNTLADRLERFIERNEELPWEPK